MSNLIINPYRFAAAGPTTIDLQQTDTAAGHSFNKYCYSGSAESASNGNSADCREGGSAGSTPITFIVTQAFTNYAAFHIESTAIGETTWAAGDYSIPINFTTAVNDLTLEQVHICRVNSSNVSQETLGSETGIAQSLSAAPLVYTSDITAVAGGTAGDAVAATDFLAFVLVFTNVHMHTARSSDITPNQLITTPIVST